MNKYKSIFIANLTEIAKPILKFMTPKQKEEEVFEDHAYCDRFVLTDRDNRVLITPFELDKDFTYEIAKLLKLKDVAYYAPKTVNESTCQAIIDDRQLYQKLREIISNNPAIKIGSYAATLEFKNLTNRLKKDGLKFQIEGVPQKNNLWTASFFDSKAGFRQAVNSLKSPFLQMPKGVICTKRSELIGWIRYFLQKKKCIVLKSNRGLAGAGLRIIHNDELAIEKIPSFLDDLFQKEPFWKSEPIVVEEYIKPNLNQCAGAPNIEMVIENNSFHYLYECGMRISNKGVFMGAEFGKGAVSPKISKFLKKAGRKFGELLRTCSYQGHFEIDFVYGGPDNKIYAIEANLRRTGGTHAFEFARRLLGDKFINNFYIVSVNKKDASCLSGTNYDKVKRLLADIYYPIDGKKEGVIISTVNYLKKGKIGYLIIGLNKKRVYQIEKIFLKKIS